MMGSAELIASAREIAAMAREDAAEVDRLRRPSDRVIQACADAGLYRILVPKTYGGLELDYGTMAKVVYELACACTSTAWVVSFYIGHNYLHALWPQGFQDEVFAKNGYALTPGTIAPNFRLTPVEGGYRASGISQWNSGSAHADWFLNSGLVMQDGKPIDALAFMVPAAEIEAIDNWDMAGMRGTASGDAQLDDVFVPTHRTVRVADLLEGNSPGGKIHAGRLYSLPLLPFIMGETIPVMVGAYRGAADALLDLNRDRTATFSGAKVREKQTSQIRIGRGQAGASLAETLMQDYIRLIDTTSAEDLRALGTRAAIRARVGLISEYVNDGIGELMLGAGAGAFRNTSPLQRFFRDMNVLRVHGFLDTDVALENLGRTCLSLEPNCPL